MAECAYVQTRFGRHCGQTYEVKSLLMLLMLWGFVKNKGADQPTHPRISYVLT